MNETEQRLIREAIATVGTFSRDVSDLAESVAELRDTQPSPQEACYLLDTVICAHASIGEILEKDVIGKTRHLLAAWV